MEGNTATTTVAPEATTATQAPEAKTEVRNTGTGTLKTKAKAPEAKAPDAKKAAEGGSAGVTYQFPKGITVEKELSAMGQKLGLSQDQMTGLLSFNQSLGKQRSEAQQKALAEEAAKLDTEWGEEKAKNVKTAQLAVKHLDKLVGGGLAKLLKESGTVANPVLVKVFHEIGKALKLDAEGTSEKKPARSQSVTKGQKKKTGWDDNPISRLYGGK